MRSERKTEDIKCTRNGGHDKSEKKKEYKGGNYRLCLCLIDCYSLY